MGEVLSAVVFREGGHLATAKDFVRFLVAEGWLAHYLDFAAERFMPPMSKLLEQPLLDPSDRHRMAAVMQITSRPTQYEYAVVSGDWRYDLVWQELVWAKAIHRVRRRRQPRAGGRRGDRAHQADPERIVIPGRRGTGGSGRRRWGWA